jgi:hypothetical protein
MRRAIVMLTMSIVVLTVSFDAFARAVENWSYERLFKESDLVVIAQPIKSENSVDRSKDNPWKIEFFGLNTTFTVDHAIKGEFKMSTLTVLHYGTDASIENGPSLVSFPTNGLSYTIERAGHPGTTVTVAGPATYLLFLKKRDDGRYEAVTGQIDPEFSVRELTTPINIEG